MRMLSWIIWLSKNTCLGNSSIHTVFIWSLVWWVGRFTVLITLSQVRVFMTLLNLHALWNLGTYLERVIDVYIFVMMINLLVRHWFLLLLVWHIFLKGNLGLRNCTRHMPLSNLINFLSAVKTSTNHIFILSLFLVILLWMCVILRQITLISIIIPLLHLYHLSNFGSIDGCGYLLRLNNIRLLIFLRMNLWILRYFSYCVPSVLIRMQILCFHSCFLCIFPRINVEVSWLASLVLLFLGINLSVLIIKFIVFCLFLKSFLHFSFIMQVWIQFFGLLAVDALESGVK